MSTKHETRVGIVGGSGYIGGELFRILLFHPQAKITTVISRQHAGDYVSRVHANLRGLTDVKFSPLDLPRLKEECDVVFTAVPHGDSRKIVPALLEAGLRVIDMGADFRLRNPAHYVEWYGWEHEQQELLKQAVYGLPEIHRREIGDAQLVACPGCMATATILGLGPMVKADMVETDRIVVDVKIGSSGAGGKPSQATHHPERFGGVRPYKPAGHRHIAEIEQELSLLSGRSLRISFSPHAVNMVRGILSTIHAFPSKSLTTQDIWKTYRSSYQGEPFIRFIRDRKGLYRLPDPKIVIGSNFCDIGFELDEHVNRLIIFSAIDNMIKGASGQAVQCLNIMLGINEKTGLEFSGFHPM